VTNTETTADRGSRIIQAAALNFCIIMQFNFLVTVFICNPPYVTGQNDRKTERLYRKNGTKFPLSLGVFYENIYKASYILVPVSKTLPVSKGVFVEEPNISKA